MQPADRPHTMRIYSPVRGAVRRTLPRPYRRALRRFLTRFVTPYLPHDVVYGAGYYESVDKAARRSARPMATTIIRELDPRSVLDVGCGTGALLAELAAIGESVGSEMSVRGLEYSDAGLAWCSRRGLEVARFNLESQASVGVERADVVISCEVAEHLPEAVADRYVDLLARSVRAGGWLVFTAATPGQGGTDHVNEQPNGYWIQKLEAVGLHYDEPRSLAWRAEWKGKTAPWYSANLMLFRAAHGA
jgi:SAM-dependent methyltransferase